jgi:hypothetical protein
MANSKGSIKTILQARLMIMNVSGYRDTFYAQKVVLVGKKYKLLSFVKQKTRKRNKLKGYGTHEHEPYGRPHVSTRK